MLLLDDRLNAFITNKDNKDKVGDNSKYYNNGVINSFNSNIDEKLFDGVLVVNNSNELYLKNSTLVMKAKEEVVINDDKSHIDINEKTSMYNIDLYMFNLI